MKTLLNIAAIIVLCLLPAACVHTNTSSVSDPDFARKRYDRVLVYVDVEDLRTRQEIEELVVEKLEEEKVLAWRGTDMFPPTRAWSDEEIQSLLLGKKFDGFLRIMILRDEAKENVRNVTTTTRKAGEEKKTRKGKTVYSETTVTTTKPDISVTYYSDFETNLIDVNTNKTAWTAMTKSSVVSGFGHRDHMLERYASDIVKALREKGHIQDN